MGDALKVWVCALFFLWGTFWAFASLPEQIKQGKVSVQNDAKVFGAPRSRLIPELSASGSGQFSDDQLAVMLQEIIGHYGVMPSQIYVLDLREEAHLFLDGIPVTLTDRPENPSQEFMWNHEKDLQDALRSLTIVHSVSRPLDHLKKQYHQHKIKKLSVHDQKKYKAKYHHYFHVNDPLDFDRPIIRTEQEIVQRYGVNYRHIPLTDHKAATVEQLKKILKMIQELPKGSWVHIHCRGGSGRTTTVLAVMEMERFKDRDFNDVLEHQFEVGGKDLAHVSLDAPDQAEAIKRLEHLKSVYDDVR